MEIKIKLNDMKYRYDVYQMFNIYFPLDEIKFLDDGDYIVNILDNKVDIYAMNLKNMLQDFFSQFGILIVVMVVMVAGSIVSEEFNKGTIKKITHHPITI